MIMAWPLNPIPKFSLIIINVYKIKIAVGCKVNIFFTFHQVSLRLKGIAKHIMIIKIKIVLSVPSALSAHVLQ